MKIIVTGSLGHISRPLVKELLEKGHTITVISSKADRQQEIEAMGATAAIGTLEDVDFLTATFTGADVVYTMIPPDNFFDPAFDFIKFYSRIAGNYANAIEQSGVKRIVHLSSIGAHLEKDSGLILAHYAAENILSKLTGVAITFMRPCAFYYNLNSFIPAIKNTGNMASNYGAEDVVAWVSPIDIAAAIAEEIETHGGDRKTRYVASEELSCNEVATQLGAAIGKPDLKWIVISDEQMQNEFTRIGMNPQIAASLVEMNASMHSGKLFEDYNKNKPEPGKTKLQEFAKDFAIAYQKD